MADSESGCWGKGGRPSGSWQMTRRSDCCICSAWPIPPRCSTYGCWPHAGTGLRHPGRRLADRTHLRPEPRDETDRGDDTAGQLGHSLVLRRCGYVKEAHYRDAWTASAGTLYDAFGYAILRDWTTGTLSPPDFADETQPAATATADQRGGAERISRFVPRQGPPSWPAGAGSWRSASRARRCRRRGSARGRAGRRRTRCRR
jgi:hypothetical protein